MHDRVYLLGFMGSGKSRIGEALAARLGWSFVDLDREIERAEGRPVREIFEESGESYFRELESRCLRTVSETPRRVIALGGGAYVDPANRRVVEDGGLSVFLDASFSTIESRIRDDGSRPLFRDRDRALRLYRRRLPSYKMAEVTVSTDDLDPDQVVERVFRAVSGP